jgi:hypothetical protein
MIVWIPIAVNEKPLLRGKIVIPEYSAAVIGSSVVLRVWRRLDWTFVCTDDSSLPYAGSRR